MPYSRERRYSNGYFARDSIFQIDSKNIAKKLKMFVNMEKTQQRQRQEHKKQHRQRRQRLLLPTACWWLLIFFSFTILQPLCTQSTPIHKTQAAHDRGPCVHDSITELIRTSPVILKALGAHIFSDDDLNGIGLPLGRVANEHNSRDNNNKKHQNEFSSSAELMLMLRRRHNDSDATAMTPSTTLAKAMQTKNYVEDKRTTATATTTPTATRMLRTPTMMATSTLTSSLKMESILITLTPETIYKGASLLKLSPGSENVARSSSFLYANAAESATPFDGQLNATLEPAHCFESNLLQLLPTELIVFGKLIELQQTELLRPQEPHQLPHSMKDQGDVLRISINGFHRWSPQFENHIWKHLGWDDWSDFTLCSVTCGKGVQQRFRRCLLDNPMVNLNMNVNSINAVNDNSDAMDDDNDDVDDDDDVLGDDVNSDDSIQEADDDDVAFEHLSSENNQARMAPKQGQGNANSTSISSAYSENDGNKLIEVKRNSLSVEHATLSTATGGGLTDSHYDADEMMRRRTSSTMTLTSENNENVQAAAAAAVPANVVNSLGVSVGVGGGEEEVMRIENMQESRNENNDKRTRKFNKRQRTAKTLETMFCEGYNIEQRNCNTFECSDDINDLLKFYRRQTMFDEASVSPASTSESNVVVTDKSEVIAQDFTGDAIDVVSVASLGDSVTSTGTLNSSLLTTPANMGYVRSWHNSLNFTIMLTLRVKNDSSKTATIFSIRNATHNLYLDHCQDGLRLYLERDNSTEMLPVKFSLYDYRWHQVAISIRNGDFISIYVDCSWTNSFVVSKRLFTLPLDADVEIGRGFNGELQQLLLLPDNQERNQCSNRRTSINEVKRYIIDTFIGDYGN